MKNLDNKKLGSGIQKSKGTNKGSYYSSKILALVYISSSEINKIISDWNENFCTEHHGLFTKMLHELGMDTSKPIEQQENLQHRNRFDEVVICTRWVGHERSDVEWIKSGYASQEALDRNKNSRLLDSSYRNRLLTVDAQEMLEERERRNKIGKQAKEDDEAQVEQPEHKLYTELVN